ncbi:hypothetical protein BAE44_0024493 [Dichanthelium oligosanthes]|uniref:F-box domain-containing protein n=1 Tax=Dichanthelium oligosanthes TaxID=888268 RepID=A0A1E5UNN7_9POAL|nr:hypothetical protein BAE44_0024493 [Dichanthelium oligosanthes]
MAARPQEDHLSDLPNGVLGHVLSFLDTKQAARAAVLYRHYRDVFASVHTLSFVQEQTSSSSSTGAASSRSDNHYEWDKEEQRRNAEFVALVDAAISCRRRCGGGDPGLRAFRGLLDAFHQSLAGHVDRWLSAAARTGGGAVEEITVDARRQERGICASERPDWYYLPSPYDDRNKEELKGESDGEDSDDFRNPKSRDRPCHVPRWLYSSCAATGGRLRTLCLGSCFLDLPRDANINFPSVETLTLTCIPDSGRDIQRLVSGCGRLADLTLDSCRRYKGPAPDEFALSFAGSSPAIVSCDIEFCGKRATSEEELANLPGFLGRFTVTRWLRLGSSCLGASIDKSNPSGLTPLPCIRHLELKGTLTCSSAMGAVARMLEQTPNLEFLTLLILPDVDEHPMPRTEVICDPEARLDVPDVLPAIPCLRNRVREMNIVQYQRGVPQRALLKLLLRVTSALEELYVVFPPGKYEIQSMLMGEIECWVMNRKQPPNLHFIINKSPVVSLI